MIDVSFNHLHTVKNNSLDNFGSKNAINFQNNLWICDCHLGYFIGWLSKTQAAISNRNEMKCASPSRYKGILLSDLNTSMMSCSSRESLTLQISDVSETYFTVSWEHNDFSHKIVENMMITYGPVFCGINCSKVHERVFRSKRYGESFTARNLKSGTSYQVCVQSEMSARQCIFVTTKKIETKSQTKSEYDNKEKTLTAVIVILTILFACSLALFFVCVYYHYREKVRGEDSHGKIFDRQNHCAGVSSYQEGTYCEDYYKGCLKRPPAAKVPTQNLIQVESFGANQIYEQCEPFLETRLKKTENIAGKKSDNLNRNRDSCMIDATTEFDSFIPVVKNIKNSNFLLVSCHSKKKKRIDSTNSRFVAKLKLLVSIKNKYF